MEILNESIEVWQVILIVLGCMLIGYFIMGLVFERMIMKSDSKLLSWRLNKEFSDTMKNIEQGRSENIHIPTHTPYGIKVYPDIKDSLNLIQWLEINCTLSSRNGWDYKGELITKEKLFSAYIKSINL